MASDDGYANDTPSLIESHEDNQSRLGSSSRYPYSCLTNDGCFTRCHPVALPPRSKESYYTESYSRSLLRLGNGTPLWDPIGNVARCPPHLKSSVMIGDVGWFDVRGDFSYYFNIFLPRTDPAQRRCPTNFEPLFPPPQPFELATNPTHFTPGTILVSPGIDVSCSSTEPLDVRFTVRAREGGMLILPDGASREDLVETSRVREYVLKHIREWYIFMNPGVHSKLTCANGSLCVVTGHDKATSWLAAQAGPYNKTGKSRTIRYSEGQWTRIIGVSAQYSKVISEYDIDHCALFVRTMRFALSTRDWIEYLLQHEPIDICAFHYIPNIPVMGFREVIQRLNERFFNKRDKPVSGEIDEHTFHPLIVVLRYLLAESPRSNVAVIDDSLWNAVAPETDGSLSLTTRALTKFFESHQVCQENGYVTLIPSSSSSKAGISRSTSPQKFPFNIPQTLKAEFQARRRRRAIASKLSKVFPGPKVPSFFMRSDPNLKH